MVVFFEQINPTQPYKYCARNEPYSNHLLSADRFEPRHLLLEVLPVFGEQVSPGAFRELQNQAQTPEKHVARLKVLTASLSSNRNCFREPAMPLATQPLSLRMRNFMSPEWISQESLRSSGWDGDRSLCSDSPAGTETASADGDSGKGRLTARVADIIGFFTWSRCFATTSFSRACECQPKVVRLRVTYLLRLLSADTVPTPTRNTLESRQSHSEVVKLLLHPLLASSRLLTRTFRFLYLPVCTLASQAWP
jgi:hypothetical protein